VTVRSSAEDGRLRSGRRSLALAIVGTLALVATLLALKPVHATVAPKTLEDGPVTRPNIVFITTDDMRMSDMAYMPNVKRLLASNGVTFSHALSPHPLCCPARAEWMTGQYGQNNGVHHNQGAHGGFPALIAPNNNLGAWLQAGGYRTAMAGKFMNGYRPADGKLAGWTHWNPTVKRVYAYADTTFFDDGAPRVAAANTDDAIVDYTTGYIREFSRSDKPFVVWASQLAPHSAFVRHRWVPPIPAVRHRKLFSRAVNPSTRKPSYLVPPPGQHTSLLRSGDLSRLHVRRIEALQAVDEGVEKIVDTLRDTGELANTYIIFTSDNGYLLGEHNLHGKNYLYDEALRVPLVVRLPGSHPATQSSTPVTLVDIAPTISDLAGVTPGRLADGTSFEQTLLAGHQPWRSSQLVQTGRASHVASDPGWLLRGVRTGTWSYWRDQRSGKVKLFNRSTDPFQLRNVAGSQRVQLRKLQRQLRVLQSCAGSACSIGVR
jgi:arylsulfatase A-like enzyme